MRRSLHYGLIMAAPQCATIIVWTVALLAGCSECDDTGADRAVRRTSIHKSDNHPRCGYLRCWGVQRTTSRRI